MYGKGKEQVGQKSTPKSMKEGLISLARVSDFHLNKTKQR
jgi:hypothetical protein